jgi:hypothetical protein
VFGEDLSRGVEELRVRLLIAPLLGRGARLGPLWKGVCRHLKHKYKTAV